MAADRQDHILPRLEPINGPKVWTRLTTEVYSWAWVVVMEVNVGTRPESVVNRRGKEARRSCDGILPFRCGETREFIGASFLGDCC